MSQHHKSQEASQEELYQKNIKEIKVSVFTLFNYYNKSIEKIPFFIFYVLSFIEFLQILWYIVHPKMNIYPDTDSIRYLRLGTLIFILGLQFINPQKLLTLKPEYNFIMVGIMFSIITIYWLSLYASYSFMKKSNRLKFFTIYVTSFMMLLLQTILYIPIFQSISPIFYCTADSQYFNPTFTCYTIEHIIIIILATITFVSLLIFKIACFIFLCQRNPLINIPLISSQNNFSSFATFLISLSMIWYFIIDTKLVLEFLYILALVLVFGVYLLFLRYYRQGCYNKKFKHFQVCLQLLYLGFSLNNVILYYLQDNSKTGLGLIQLVLTMILLSFLVKQYFFYTTNRKLRQLFAHGMDKLKPEQIIFSLIKCLVLQENAKKRQTCAKILIKSSKLSKNITQNFKWTNFLQNKFKPTQKQYSLIVFTFLKNFLQDCISQHSSFFLEAVLCVVLYELDLKSKCIYQVAKLQKKKPNLLDQFLIFQIKQKQILLKQANQQHQSQSLTINSIIKYKKYLDLLAQMESCISRSITSCTQYWNQFLQEEPDFLYLQKAIKKILTNNVKVAQLNQQIRTISQSNIKSKFLYFSYMEVLQWTKAHHQQLQIFNNLSNYLGKSQQMQKCTINSLDQKKIDIKFQQNQRLVAIEVDFSTSDSIITNCNSQIANFIGYTKAEIMDKKLDKIIPKIYASSHFKFVEAFIDRQDSYQPSSSKIIYALSKKKFLEPGLLTIKLLVTAQKGLNIISFIKPLQLQESSMTIITSDNSTKIEGVSKFIETLTNDQQTFKNLKNLECQMQMFFPQINFQSIKQGKLYETLIATQTQQNQSIQVNYKKASLIMERKNHHDLKLKYYTVHLIEQKPQRNIIKSISAFTCFKDKSSKTLLESEIIQNQSNQQEGQSQSIKISRLKQNLSTNFNRKKYIFGSLLLLILIGGLFYLYIVEYDEEITNLANIRLSSKQANILDNISGSMSNMTIQVEQMLHAAIFQTLTTQQQKQQKNIYINSLNLFNINFDSFVSNLKSEIAEYHSIFSFNINPNRPNKIKQLYNFQEVILKFIDSYGAGLTVGLIHEHQALFNQLVSSQVLLSSYFDQQLDKKTQMIEQNQSVHQNQSLIFIYLKIGLMTCLSFGLCFLISKISQNKDKNLMFLCNVNVIDVNLVILKLEEFNRQFFVEGNLQQVFQQTITTLKSSRNITSASGLLSFKKINQRRIAKTKFKQSKKRSKEVLGLFQEQSKSNKSLISKKSNEKPKQNRTSFEEQLNDQISEVLFKQAISIINSQTSKKKSFFSKQKQPKVQLKNQQDQQFLKKREKRKNTFNNKNVQLTHNKYKQKILILLTIALVFAGINMILYSIGENLESQQISNQQIIMNLIRLNVKIMHIRSILRIHFTSMTDINNNLYINQTNFDNQITFLRQYLSEAQPYIGDPVPILKHLYEDVENIFHLKQAVKANSSISATIHDQFQKVEMQLQNHRDQLTGFINNLNVLNSQINSNRTLRLNIEIVILILLTISIVVFQYLKIVTSSQQDEKTTFEMIRLLPISLIKQNEKIKNGLISLSHEGSQ